MKKTDKKSKEHYFNIEKKTLENNNYRKVVYSDKYQQLVGS